MGKFLLIFLTFVFILSCDKSFDATNPFGVKDDYGYEKGRCLVTSDCGTDDLGCNLNTNKCELHKGGCDACKGSDSCEGKGAEGNAVFRCVNGNSNTNSCDGVDCGGKGACVFTGDIATCNCNEGYQDNNHNLICTPKCEENECGEYAKCNDTDRDKKFCECIDGVTCGEHGTCSDDTEAGAVCECGEGYKANKKFQCVPEYWKDIAKNLGISMNKKLYYLSNMKRINNDNWKKIFGDFIINDNDELFEYRCSYEDCSIIKIDDNKGWEKIAKAHYDEDDTFCGIRNGELYCWGYNNFGQLGLGNNDSVNTPTKVGNMTSWEDVTIGIRTSPDTSHIPFFSTFAIENGKLYCWGANYEHSLGLPASYLSKYDDCIEDQQGYGYCNKPIKLGNKNNWTFVKVINNITYGIESGKLYCWGEDYKVPTKISEKTNYLMLNRSNLANKFWVIINSEIYIYNVVSNTEEKIEGSVTGCTDISVQYAICNNELYHIHSSSPDGETESYKLVKVE